MGRIRLVVVLTIVVGGFGVSAVAAVGPGQRTEPVSAVFAADRLAVVYERTCAGADGQYRQAVETYGGTISGDPRLTGMGMMFLTSYTNTTTGNGTALGTLVVTDVSTHAVRFRAGLQGVIVRDGSLSDIKGVMTGLVQDRGTQAGGRLVANFMSIGFGTQIYLGLGGSGTAPMPAVIQSGSCPRPAAR